MPGKPNRHSFHTPRMTFLGTVRGTGKLTVAGATGDVRYEIDRYRTRAQTVANGRITGPVALISDAFTAEKAQLMLEDGGVVGISLPVDPAGDECAEIEIDDPLPQFAAEDPSNG